MANPWDKYIEPAGPSGEAIVTDDAGRDWRVTAEPERFPRDVLVLSHDEVAVLVAALRGQPMPKLSRAHLANAKRALGGEVVAARVLV